MYWFIYFRKLYTFTLLTGKYVGKQVEWLFLARKNRPEVFFHIVKICLAKRKYLERCSTHTARNRMKSVWKCIVSVDRKRGESRQFSKEEESVKKWYSVEVDPWEHKENQYNVYNVCLGTWVKNDNDFLGNPLYTSSTRLYEINLKMEKFSIFPHRVDIIHKLL